MKLDIIEKAFIPCRRCLHGRVFSNNGEYRCIQCSAEHTPDGELINPLILEKVFISCQVCDAKFWSLFANKAQECPQCGQRNYKKAILGTTKKGEGRRRDGQATGISSIGKQRGRPRSSGLDKVRQQSASEEIRRGKE